MGLEEEFGGLLRRVGDLIGGLLRRVGDLIGGLLRRVGEGCEKSKLSLELPVLVVGR